MQGLHEFERYLISTTAEALALSVYISCVDDEAHSIYALDTF